MKKIAVACAALAVLLIGVALGPRETRFYSNRTFADAKVEKTLWGITYSVAHEDSDVSTWIKEVSPDASKADIAWYPTVTYRKSCLGSSGMTKHGGNEMYNLAGLIYALRAVDGDAGALAILRKYQDLSSTNYEALRAEVTARRFQPLLHGLP